MTRNTALKRLRNVQNSFGRVARQASSIAQAKAELLRHQPDDVVLVMAKRTPLCKAYKGAYKDMRVDELMTSTFKAILKEMPMKLNEIEDICVGVVQGQNNETAARTAALAAGIPESIPIQTINRFCSSGLMAVSVVSNQIRSGETDCGLAVGVESLSANPLSIVDTLSNEIMEHPAARDCLQGMGWTSENVVEEFGIRREDMDAFAARSHQRAEAAQRDGIFDQEIMPIEAIQGDASEPASRRRVMIKADDGLRKGTTVESLAKARSAFPQFGKGYSTGGNTSQITDGAAAVILMRRDKAESLGLSILAKHIGTTSVGLAPRIMGIGPALAIPKILAKYGLAKDDVDLFEINEAFSSMCAYVMKQLALDAEKVNVRGGAIALGHPYACTGARQIATGLAELNRREADVLVTSMCIGLGMGSASVFVRN